MCWIRNDIDSYFHNKFSLSNYYYFPMAEFAKAASPDKYKECQIIVAL